MIDVKKVADKADMIVNGYAYTIENDIIRVLNLHKTDSAAVLSLDGEVLATSMYDIEVEIVLNYFRRNRSLLEMSHYESNS